MVLLRIKYFSLLIEMVLPYKKKSLIFVLLFLLLNFFNVNKENLFAQSNNINNNSLKNPDNFLNEIQSEYILGPGDQIFINFLGLNIFTGKYNVDPDGRIFLPELDNVKAEGKTITELKNFLIDKYKGIIINPKLNITITSYRPVIFFLGGEVNRPGVYTLEYQTNNISNTSSSENDTSSVTSKKVTTVPILFPRLFDAIQKGNGITNNANLKEVKVIRENSLSQGGGKIKANINLLSLLKKGDQNQNIRIFDGDSIFISRSSTSTLDQLVDINRTNLAPEKIQVFVNGNVRRPGSTTVRQGSSLISALASVGGENSRTGNIDFIRLKRNGKTEKRTFSYDVKATKGSLKNPVLIDGDIIVVRKNILGKTKQVFDDLGSPIFSGYGLYKLFD